MSQWRDPYSGLLLARLRELAVLLALLAPAGLAEGQEVPSEPTPGLPAPVSVEPSEAELAAELAALRDQESASTLEPDELSLELYGFADAMVIKSFPRVKNAIYPLSQASFLVGNVNLYAAANLTRGFSSLIEVRFTYIPNGSPDPKTLQYTSTYATDQADYLRLVRWGGIILERVHLDYSYRGWLNARFGSFLTPYGIWNVDHGSPTIIPIVRPYSIGEQLFPTRQTGLELFGSFLLRDTTLGYHLTLSNGRGDFEQVDLDANKALGWRLFATWAELGTLTLGLSGYYGRATREVRLSVLTTSPVVKVARQSLDQFDELALAADLRWEVGRVLLQSEFISRQVNYVDPGRKLVTLSQGTAFISDNFAWGLYVLLAYRTPWLGITPYALFQTFDRGYGRDEIFVFGGNTINGMATVFGLNVRPVPAVALKAQFSFAWVPDKGRDVANPNLAFQAAWAF